MLNVPDKSTIHKDLFASLVSIKAGLKFDELITALGDISAENIALSRAFFDDKIDSLSTLITDLVIDGDEIELDFQLATIWLQTRLEWNLYNLQMQYQTATRGEACKVLMARGACLSQLVTLVERHLDTSRVYWLNHLATDPISTVSKRTELIDRLIEITEASENQTNKMANSLIDIRDRLGPHDLSRQIAATIKSSIGIIKLLPNDFYQAAESTILKSFSKCNLRFSISGLVDETVQFVTPAVSQIIFQCIEQWLTHAKISSFEANSQERQQSKKSHHVNLKWFLKKVDDLIVFEMSDDGLGSNSFVWKNAKDNSLNTKVTVTNNFGQGSLLNLQMYESPVRVHTVGFLDPENYFSLEASEVSRVEKNIKKTQRINHQDCVISQTDEIYILINLFDSFRVKETGSCTYLFLKKTGSEKYPICLKVGEVVGFQNTSIMPVDIYFKNFVRGYFKYNTRTVTVLDLEMLKQMTLGVA